MEISDAFEAVNNIPAQYAETPGFSVNSLSKHEGEPKHHNEYRSVVES